MAILVNDTTPRNQYTATSGQTVFAYSFEIFDVTDVKVYNGSTLLTYASSPSGGTQYSVSNAGVTGGGNITLGSGGVFSELSNDNISILVPSSKREIESALKKLKVWKILTGYRGLEGADINALLETIMALQNYVIKSSERILELEINPLICNKQGAFIADALIMERDL